MGGSKALAERKRFGRALKNAIWELKAGGRQGLNWQVYMRSLENKSAKETI
jgi:hypothetical protein